MFGDQNPRAALATSTAAGFARLGLDTTARPISRAVAAGISHSITYRAGTLSDCRELARFICQAGGGVYEYLFDDLIPLLTATWFLAVAAASRRYSISHRNCFVAVDAGTNAVIGAANVFPADLIRKENNAVLPFKRRSHIRPMLELQDWGSMFLNALAVNEQHRCRGVGARLLAWAEDHARRAGFDRLSLHVWVDNTTALNFYKARGYVALAVADIPYDPRLQHVGGSVLMQRRIGEAV